MKGYTRKVGLRKSPLHFDALRMRKRVRHVPDDDHRWLDSILARIKAGSDRALGLIQDDIDGGREFVEAENEKLRQNLEDMLAQMRRESGGADVADMECAALDPSSCATHGWANPELITDFDEVDVAPGVTVAVERKPCPHCPCTQTTECCYCDGTRTPLEDS